MFTRAEVRQHNARTRDLVARQGSMRIQVAFFRCPWPVSLRQYERIRKAAIDRWVAYMDRDGWQLISRVHVRTDKRRTSHRPVGDWYQTAILDEVEIPVAAAFKKRDMEITRIEVPVMDAAE